MAILALMHTLRRVYRVESEYLDEHQFTTRTLLSTVRHASEMMVAFVL
jgi:hypothetical protein